jgi:hypothetical protein
MKEFEAGGIHVKEKQSQAALDVKYANHISACNVKGREKQTIMPCHEPSPTLSVGIMRLPSRNRHLRFQRYPGCYC